MTIEALKHEISVYFSKKPNSDINDEVTLPEKLFFAYNKWVSDKIEAILQDTKQEDPSEYPSRLAQNFANFLEENWELVKGSCLCPTAIAFTPVTECLCKIAEFVAENTTDVPPLQLLIPGVITEPSDENYPDLSTESIIDILRTHILREDGSCLLPLSSLLEIDETSTDYKLRNPYYDTNYSGSDDAPFFISHEEFQRLIDHNSLTKELGEALTNFDTLSNNKNNLLGQLNLLCRRLIFNSAHGGIGSQENSGVGAYPAIIEFNTYYMQLDEPQKNKIPGPLRDEINKLVDLASNPAININATETMETCIGTRQEKLVALMQGNETLLSDVTLSDQKLGELIGAAKASFLNAKKGLKNALEKKDLPKDSKDTLPLNITLMRNLQVQATVNNMSDLYALAKLSTTDLTRLLQDTSEMRSRILITLNGGMPLNEEGPLLENWVVPLFSISVEKVNLFMGFFGREILLALEEQYKKNADFLNIAGLRERFEEKHTYRLYMLRGILMAAPLEKFTVITQVLQEDLVGAIETISHFYHFFKELSSEQRNACFPYIQDKLLSISNRPGNFGLVLDMISPAQKKEFFQKAKSKIFIKTASEFSDLIRSLDLEQGTELISMLGTTLVNMISSPQDLAVLMSDINDSAQRAMVFDIISKGRNGKKDPMKMTWIGVDTLITTFKNPEQLRLALKLLHPITFSEHFNIKDLRSLDTESSEQEEVFFESMESALPSLKCNSDDFKALFSPPHSLKSLKSLFVLMSALNSTINEKESLLESQVLWSAKPIIADPGKTINQRLLMAAQVLDCYVKRNAIARFSLARFFAPPPPAHIAQVALLVNEIKNGQIPNEENLHQRLKTILIDQSNIDFKSDLFKTIGIVLKQYFVPKMEADETYTSKPSI